jgi:hypothetical protein
MAILLFEIAVGGGGGSLPTSNHERACLDVPDPANGAQGPGTVLASRIKVLIIRKRDGLAQVLASERIAPK